MTEKSNSNNPALHAGHRQRLKNRFLNEGLDGFETHNLLELLLFYSNPRQDTNDIAHLLERMFGSFADVCDADFDALCSVEGVGREGAILIKMIPELCRRYAVSRTGELTAIYNSEDVIEYFKSRFIGYTVEMFMICYLDAKSCIIKSTKHPPGADGSIQIDVQKVFAEAIFLRAKGIVIAHNHPHGFAVPSQQDIAITEELHSLIKGLGVALCEHIIVSGADTFCMSKMNNLKKNYFVFS